MIFVICFCGGYDGDVEIVNLVDFVLIDFVEYVLFLEIEGVVVVVVELFG